MLTNVYTWPHHSLVVADSLHILDSTVMNQVLNCDNKKVFIVETNEPHRHPQTGQPTQPHQVAYWNLIITTETKNFKSWSKLQRLMNLITNADSMLTPGVSRCLVGWSMGKRLPAGLQGVCFKSGHTEDPVAAAGNPTSQIQDDLQLNPLQHEVTSDFLIFYFLTWWSQKIRDDYLKM